MKLFTKIVSILLVAGLASATAQSAKNFYVKGSVGYADLNSEGGLNEKTKGFAVMSGMDLKLDSATSHSLEGGMYFDENLSFGFEWTTFDSGAEAGRDFDPAVSGFTSDHLIAINNFLGGQLETEGVTTFKEEIDLDRFMFVFNYEHFFNEQFSLLINTGLGILDVEQKIKVASLASQKINSKADETSFAYQIGLSLGYHFNKNISLYGGGRYLGGSDVDFKQKFADGRTISFGGFSPSAFVFELGMTRNF